MNPGHDVDAWICHDDKVARHYYLQVTHEHFARPVQNPVRYPAALGRTKLPTKKATPKKPRELPCNAAQCEAVQNDQVGVTGLETDLKNPAFLDNDGRGEAESEAVDAESTAFDADLQTIVERWPDLPDALRAGILAMIDATIGNVE